MKKIILLIVSLLVPISISAGSNDLKVMNETGNFASHAESAIMIDAKTGKVIYEKNSHKKLAPASMTKMMTMLLTLEAIENNMISWNDIVTVSENASSMGGSQILLETNEKMSVYDLFKGVAVASGNDAAVALAETVYGSTEEFVKEMNKKANELGLKDTNFKNVHGLDIENHYSSAYDMAYLAKELARHEKVFEFTSIYEDYLRKGTDREFWLVNTNKLVRYYNGVDGLKTGYTPEAGYCLTATAKKNDMRLIVVVMGEPTPQDRNSEVSELLNYGFSQYQSISVVKKNQVITDIELIKAKNKIIDIVAKEDYSLFIKKNEKPGKITYDFKLNDININIKKGDEVGILYILENGKKIKEVPLTIKNNIEKANFITLFKRYLINIIIGNINFKA